MARILFVDHSGVLGGAELYLLDVARYYGDAASVVLFEDGPFRRRLEDAGIRTFILPAPDNFLSVEKQAGIAESVRAIPGVVSLMTKIARRAQDHDLVFANSQKALIAAAPAAWWADRPFVWNLHDMLTAGHFSPLNRYLATSLANAFAHRVIVNSKSTRRAFIESGGDAGRAHVVYNGFDPTRFASPDPEKIRALRQKLDVGNGPLLGVFSRLTPWKGQHVLIDALTDLPDTHALLAGASLFDDEGSYDDKLRRRAARQGVADRVHFLGFREDVPQLMHVVDVVVHTSTAPEPFGRVIVEGMLAGKPVIGTRAGGAREIIEDRETGLLVPPGDSNALAGAVESLLSDPEWACSMGSAARAYARDRFSIEKMQRSVNRVLEHLPTNAEATLRP